MLLEVCVDSIQSALAAKAGGAQRLEVCANLAAGGTTPNDGLVQRCVEMQGIATAMMIRPRAGDFCYDADDLSVIQADIAVARLLAVDGIVFGALTRDHTVDVEVCRRIIEWARPLSVTFHRAFDIAAEPMAAMQTLLELGIDRLLTSGQQPTALQGMDLIARLVARCDDRLTVMAGSGINPGNVAQIVKYTGVTEIHASASVARPMKSKPTRDWFASTPLRVTDAKTVQEILTSANHHKP